MGIQQYEAWTTENGTELQRITINAPSLRSAKTIATRKLGVEYGTWNEGTVCFENGNPCYGWYKALGGRERSTGLYPELYLKLNISD